jgi:hypothetical protein
MSSPEPSAAGASTGGESTSYTSVVEPIRIPTPEEIRGQDIRNNCAVKSVTHGVIGTLLCVPTLYIIAHNLAVNRMDHSTV